MLPNFLVVLWCVVVTIPHVRGKICESIDVRNSIVELNKLRNCTEITGSLYIVLLDFEATSSTSEYEEYVFPELTKVTDFVIVYSVKHLTSLAKLFPNLRLIRGLTLFMNYALILYNLPDLEEIGTDKLLYIARGYVKVGRTPKLCYATTIMWNHIGNNTYMHYDNRGKKDCPTCPAKCGNWCWNQDKCQTFTDNCHTECLGCTRSNSNSHCIVCKNFEDEGICVPDCPKNKYVIRTRNKCITKQECLDQNNHQANQTATPVKTWIIHDQECRSDCPVGTAFDAKKTSCIPCGQKCIKYCNATELNNVASIQALAGCSHINNSLSIVGIRNEQEEDELYTNLYTIREIRGYLQIARNDILKDINFLPNLRVLGGEELVGGHSSSTGKSLFVYENRNLKSLWNMAGHFSLKIRKGHIGFHYNDRLCLNEIEAFANASGITYTDTDVSRHSNGPKCLAPIAESLFVNVTEINTNNVTIVWEGNSDVLYYTIYFSDEENDTKTTDIQDCAYNPWKTMSTSNNSIQLLNLRSYRNYFFFIKIYTTDGLIKRSKLKSFKTLPGDPSVPAMFTADAIDHESIMLKWSKPVQVNGDLSNYTIYVYMLEDSPSILDQRNYCQYPQSSKGYDVDNDDNSELNTTTTTYPPRDPCEPITSEELNFKLLNDIWLNLCDKDATSKYGVDQCQNYYYDMWNEPNVSHKKRSQDDEKFFPVFPGPEAVNKTIRNLRQFTNYVFYLMACNKEIDERKLCSGIIQTVVRTKRKPYADDIQQIDIKVVNEFDVDISWDAPETPNSFIVSYNINYKRDLEHSQTTTVCIPEAKHLRKKRYILKQLLPGDYHLTLQAISLAGPGNFTQKFFIQIGSNTKNSLWLIFLTAILLLIFLAGIFIYFHMKRKRAMERIQLIANVNPDYAGLVYVEDDWEMDRKDVELGERKGDGNFGTVYIGRIKSKNIPCAVKTVSTDATDQERLSFLTEANVMKEFSGAHHVVKLLGVVSRGQPPLVVMELMDRGDLKRYLKEQRKCPQELTTNEMYRMAIEIADGLTFLTSRKYVHRDIAARNCMVASDKTIKIGDFGMARDVYQSDYYKKGSRGLLPIRWMAPESLADGVYTSDSDMWGFGIVLWEIVKYAEQPYQGFSNEEVVQWIMSKGTLDRPQDCPNVLWDIMKRCWNWYPSRRPTCFEVIELLQNSVGQNFRLVSFFHSKEGHEFLNTHSLRTNNPPALGMGAFVYNDNVEENDPLNGKGGNHSYEEHDYIPPSSPQKNSRLTEEFH